MKLSEPKYRLLLRKITTVVLLSASLVGFAALGDGGKKDASQRRLLSTKAPLSYKGFSLRSGYNYRGSSVLSNHGQKSYIVLDKVITLQKGNQTYILPLKKKVLLERIKFDPTKR